MASTITLDVRPRGKPIENLPQEIKVPTTATGADLYNALAEQSSFSIHRLRVTKGSDGSLISGVKGPSVHDTGLRDQSTIYVKDLGPQIAWRTVFIIEYLGPLLIHPLTLYILRPYIYSNAAGSDPSPLQSLTCALLVLHFFKREFETIFIHRFSLATMPMRNIFKNSAHYWILAGANIAYWVFAPDSPTAVEEANPLLLYPGLFLFVFGQLANLSSHVTLRNLRRTGSTERGIPTGFGFGLVTCPNYLFETLAWVGIYLVSGLSWSVLVFIIVAAAQMMIWAKGKERRYRKEFGDKYKNKRYVIFPGLY
ncbi:3-oxo-5a-steroid 4- dehydrogenase [Arachnomyces sp. PD_36]|nr:3-oxo-5a-steroid 4- dehydrogenase [Arachnomyces sp. PD_36]